MACCLGNDFIYDMKFKDISEVKSIWNKSRLKEVRNISVVGWMNLCSQSQ